jgi:hypothetical protein
MKKIFTFFVLVIIDGAVSLSVSSCSDLGWTNAADYGSTSVCGESDLELGDCSGLMDWYEADLFCRGKWGPPKFAEVGRLCTLDELDNGEAQDAGCGYDSNFIWSTHPCGTNSYYQSDGSTHQCESLYDSTTGYARCCSDIDLLSVRGSAGTCSGLRTWRRAKNFCESKGARLCTISELVNEEPRGTGCNLDGKLIWSSDSCTGRISISPATNTLVLT